MEGVEVHFASPLLRPFSTTLSNADMQSSQSRLTLACNQLSSLPHSLPHSHILSRKLNTIQLIYVFDDHLAARLNHHETCEIASHGH